ERPIGRIARVVRIVAVQNQTDGGIESIARDLLCVRRSAARNECRGGKRRACLESHDSSLSRKNGTQALSGLHVRLQDWRYAGGARDRYAARNATATEPLTVEAAASGVGGGMW